MIDIHAHILPGIDDGPAEWDKSLKMLRRAAQDGITGIVAAPHVVPGGYDNTAERVLGLVSELKDRTRVSELEVYPGSELMVCNETLRGLEGGKYLTINRGRYALVELPAQFEVREALDFVFSLKAHRRVAIVAHPERNPRIQEDPDILYEMAMLGALVQVTAGSLNGVFGGRAKDTADALLSSGLCHIIASDAHDIGRRAPVLSHGLKEAGRIVGERAALGMVRETPRMVVDDEKIEVPEPARQKKKKFLFF